MIFRKKKLEEREKKEKQELEEREYGENRWGKEVRRESIRSGI